MAKRPSPIRPEPEATEPREDDSFVGRWARRKGEARSGRDPDAEEPASEEEAAEQAAVEPPELTDADMPSLDAIDEHTDMSGFLSPKVTEGLKKVALRKFFHSPVFNIVDGLDDYDDDFTAFEALGDIITSDMRGQMELEERRAKEALAEQTEAPVGEDTAEVEPGDDTEAPAEPAAADSHSGDSESADADEPRGVTREPSAASVGKLRRKHTDDDHA